MERALKNELRHAKNRPRFPLGGLVRDGGGENVEITILKLIAVMLSSFSLGFAAANTLWVFHVNSSDKKRKNGNDKSGKTDGEGND